MYFKLWLFRLTQRQENRLDYVFMYVERRNSELRDSSILIIDSLVIPWWGGVGIDSSWRKVESNSIAQALEYLTLRGRIL